MTAYAITRYQIYCNGRTVNTSSETGGRPCLKPYLPPEDAEDGIKPSALRKLAAKDGWSHVRSPYGRRFDNDYCPDHTPQEATSG